MIKQIKYFQALVRCRNFSEAAEMCYISQSAMSQQLQALEKNLGTKLLVREKRQFTLTPAGEYFYKKSLPLVRSYDKLIAETRNIGKGVKETLNIGYPRQYSGNTMQRVIPIFKQRHPEVELHLASGTHEELYRGLRDGSLDLVVNDLRRKFSDKYVNYYLCKGWAYAELPEHHPLARRDFLETSDLSDLPCILIAPENEEETEAAFYREYFGVQSEIIFTRNRDEARMAVFAGHGWRPRELLTDEKSTEDGLVYLKLLNDGAGIEREYYAFWQVKSAKVYIEDFAVFLEQQFMAR